MTLDPDVWHQHLIEQDRLDNIRDTKLYAEDDGFVAARRVIDLGTGYGHHVGILATDWPDKTFVGIDSDVAAIAFARETYRAPNLSFVIDDVNDGSVAERVGPQDYAIARLLVQHLSSVSHFAETVARMLTSGGGLFVLDVHEPSKQFVPAMPEYSAIFSRLRDEQRRRRGDEEVFSLPRYLKHAGFRITSETIIVKSTDGDLDRDQLHTVLSTNLSVVGDVFRIPGDYDAARTQLTQWDASDTRYGSLGDYLLRARKE